MRIFKSWTFTWWEIGFIKVCLISLGILVGIYFAAFVAGFTWLWWTLFIVTALYFIARLFRGDKKPSV